MRFDVLTLFPDLIRQGLDHSITARAQAAGHVDVGVTDIREFSTNKHRNVDDTPYGGGPGMIMGPDAVVGAIESVRAARPVAKVALMSPSGRRFDQSMARALAHEEGAIVLVCGRYEGVDARVAEHYCDLELSIGDYVLTGGELAALVVIDAVTRLVPGALGNAQSPADESLEDGLLEHPQYTRPRDFRGHAVPDVLLSGDHARIARWRRARALQRTRTRRPDLWASFEAEHGLSANDKKLLES